MNHYRSKHDDDYRKIALLAYYLETQVRIKREFLVLSKVEDSQEDA